MTQNNTHLHTIGGVEQTDEARLHTTGGVEWGGSQRILFFGFGSTFLQDFKWWYGKTE